MGSYVGKMWPEEDDEQRNKRAEEDSEARLKLLAAEYLKRVSDQVTKDMNKEQVMQYVSKDKEFIKGLFRNYPKGPQKRPPIRQPFEEASQSSQEGSEIPVKRPRTVIEEAPKASVSTSENLEARADNNELPSKATTSTSHKPEEGTSHKPKEGTSHKPEEGTSHKPKEGTSHKPEEGTSHKPEEGQHMIPNDAPKETLSTTLENSEEVHGTENEAHQEELNSAPEKPEASNETLSGTSEKPEECCCSATDETPKEELSGTSEKPQDRQYTATKRRASECDYKSIIDDERGNDGKIYIKLTTEGNISRRAQSLPADPLNPASEPPCQKRRKSELATDAVAKETDKGLLEELKKLRCKSPIMWHYAAQTADAARAAAAASVQHPVAVKITPPTSTQVTSLLKDDKE
ncbi:hypothetical protein ACJJTC_002408 [Scirpophaga incertulas]